MHYDGNKIINTTTIRARIAVSGDKHRDDADVSGTEKRLVKLPSLFMNGCRYAGSDYEGDKGKLLAHEFSDSDTYDEDAAVINYTVKEVPVEVYTVNKRL